VKIHILSDFHSEFDDFEYIENDSDVVVLAGDINLKERGIAWVLDTIKNKPVIYVMGNHEYYTSAYPKLLNSIKDMCKNTNVHVLENDQVKIGDVDFFGCTLWTNFKLLGDPRLSGYQCQQVMSDYKKIRLTPKYSKLRSIDVAAINQRSINWLKSELRASDSQSKVVVTHHAPSVKSLPEEFRTDPVSAAYASNHEDLILEYSPKLWIHGHIHSKSDYKIGNTRIVCNPRGYPDEDVLNFDHGLVHEI